MEQEHEPKNAGRDGGDERAEDRRRHGFGLDEGIGHHEKSPFCYGGQPSNALARPMMMTTPTPVAAPMVTPLIQ